MTSMADHLRAVEAKLDTSTPVDLFAPKAGRQPPFYSIEAPPWGTDPDAPLARCDGPLQVDIRIRACTGTPDGAAIMLDRVRAAIPGRLAVAHRYAEIAYERSEMVERDDDSTSPLTGDHTYVGVDTYTLTSQPL